MKKIYTLLFILSSSICIGQAEILLDYNFDNTSNLYPWSTTKSKTEFARINTGRGVYIIHHKKKSGTLPATMPLKIDEHRDFKISAQIYKDKGVLDYGFGLLWGGKLKNYYSFMISATGYFIVGKVENGIWQNLVPNGWIASDAIKQGNSKYNTLALSKIGDRYHFEINGYEVATMPLGNFYGDWVGFNVNNKQRILADWIKVEYLR